MYRISMGMDWSDLERLASDIGGTLVYRKARCQHGKTRSESCHPCEMGYATDGHCFARINGSIARWNGSDCVAVSDDGEDAAYLPAKYESRIGLHEPVEVLKRLSRPGAITHGLYTLDRVIQRLNARLYNYRLIEMQSAIVHISVPPMVDLDEAAWADINGFSPADARPSVRSLSDGSRVTCHYFDGIPQWRRFARGV